MSRSICGKEPQGRRRDQRHVDWEQQADIVGGRAQARHDARDGSPYIGSVVNELEREVEAVGRLADRDPLVARLAEETPGTLRERFAVQVRQCFRRAEAPTRAADEENTCYSPIRHGSV
jgi:hypothetical protein